MRNLLRFYFNPTGRVGRKDFWLRGVLVALLVDSLLGSIDKTLAHPRHDLILHIDFAISPWDWLLNLGPRAPFESLFAIPLAWVEIAVAIKRLHDVGRPAAWLVGLIGLAMLLQGAMGWLLPVAVASGDLHTLVVFLALLISLGPILILGWMRGNSGANAYGRDPLEAEKLTQPAINPGASAPSP